MCGKVLNMKALENIPYHVLTISKEYWQYQKNRGFIFKMNLHDTAIYRLVYSLAAKQKQINSFMVFMLINTKGCRAAVYTNNMDRG